MGTTFTSKVDQPRMDAHHAMEVEMSGQISELNLTSDQKVRLAVELRTAVRECRDRGLGVSAKWASELLSAIPAEFRIPQRQHARSQGRFSEREPAPPTEPLSAAELQSLRDIGCRYSMIEGIPARTVREVLRDHQSGVMSTFEVLRWGEGVRDEKTRARDVGRLAGIVGAGIGQGEYGAANHGFANTHPARGDGPHDLDFPRHYPSHSDPPPAVHVPYLSSPFFDPTDPGVSTSTPPPASRTSGNGSGLVKALYTPEYRTYPGSVDARDTAADRIHMGERNGHVGGGRQTFGSVASPAAEVSERMGSGFQAYEFASTPAQRHPIPGGSSSNAFAYQTPQIARPARSGLSNVHATEDSFQPVPASHYTDDPAGIVGGDRVGRGTGPIHMDGLSSVHPYSVNSPDRAGGPPSFENQLRKMTGGERGPGPSDHERPPQAVPPSHTDYDMAWQGTPPGGPSVSLQQAISPPLSFPGNPQHPESRDDYSDGNHEGTAELHPHLAASPAGALSSIPHMNPPISSLTASAIHRPHAPPSALIPHGQSFAGNPGYPTATTSKARGKPLAPLVQGRQPEHPDDFEALEQDTFDLAKSYFDSKELERCKVVLEKCTSKRARFLSLYSQYLAADKRAQEMLPHFLDSKTEMETMTPQIYPLIEVLEDEDDAYLLYLRGQLYARTGQKDRALESYIRSLHGAPYNWSCWVNVAMIVQSAEEYLEIKILLPQGIMLAFFAIAVMLDLHSATELMMNTIDKLEETFPTSVHLKASRALVLYHMRDFDQAEKAFDEVRKIDPFRLDEIEIYSNMLYVMNKKPKLGKMAHEYAQIDKNRAEVCCLIGNYYSSRNEHTKAIQYFKRSLQLNRDYLPAWTLMGHEYVEIKNSHAAVESYRRAIECNPKDYRAWYGLGQTYEILDMPFYAVQYYSRATALRPYDCRMWTALADLYQTLKRPADAIACDYRALYGADPGQTLKILITLADLHDSLRQLHSAADCHERYIVHAEKEKAHIGETARSYLYVARFHLGLLHRDRNADLAPVQPASTTGDGMDVEVVDDAATKALKALRPSDLDKGVRYLQTVMQSNAPLKEEAMDEWRYVQKRLKLPQPAGSQV